MILALENLSFAYGKRAILNDLSLELTPGKIHYLAGSNGSGKSTLLKLICGALRPTAGRVMLDNRNIESFSGSARGRLIGAMWQENAPALDFTVREMVSILASARFPRWNSLSKQAWSKVDKAIEIFALEAFARQPVNTLSGGERQRVMLAGVAALEPEIMLLDEPTSALDPAYRKLAAEFLAQYAQDHIVLAVTHDLGWLAKAQGTLILLDTSENPCCGKAEKLLQSQLLSRIYRTPVTVEELSDGSKRIYFD